VRRRWGLVVVAGTFAGCSGKVLSVSPEATDSGGTSASDARTPPESASAGFCNPLAAHPTKLATLLGVGEDPSGALYVADVGGIPTEPTVVRVFVPSDGSLVRQYVIGSGGNGGSTNGEDVATFESADGSVAPRDLAIYFAGGTVDSMTLGPESSGKLNAERRDGGTTTPLTLLDATAVRGMPAIDLPGAVQYVADAADGEAIVVTAPLEDDEGSAAFHLFYGTTAKAMIERPIVSFNQSGSGYPSIGFTVGSAMYTMSITSVPSDGGLGEAPGPVMLTNGDGSTVSFTLRLPTPTSLGGFAFTCLPALADAGSTDAGTLAACSVMSEGLDRSCTKDTDCVAVGFGDLCADPCLADPASIVNAAINASALGAYGAAVTLAEKAAASDPNAVHVSCGQGYSGDASALMRGLDGSFAACSAGLCVTTK
jgi:hypothetical protein